MKKNYLQLWKWMGLASALCLTGPVYVQAQAICFIDHADNPFSVGADPFEIRSADFNNDGRPDFVTTNTNSAAVSVMLSDGSGDYLPSVNYAVGGFAPYSAAVGDIDGDNDIDIAVGNGLGNNVTVLKNNGSGVFVGGGSFAVGTYPLSTSMADLNGDNILDIITANQTTNNVSVLLSTGPAPTYAPVVNYAVGTQPKSANVGDVDNDGDIDIVASSMNSGEIHVLKNNGSGTMTVGTPYSVSYGVKTITLGDLNGDNYNDIMVTRYSSGNVLTMMNDGTGNFLPYTSYFGIYTPEFSTLDDMNNDGHLDVVIASQGLPPIVIMLNDGTGNLTAPTGYPYGISGDFTMGVAVCDVNIDGKKDIAFTQFGPDKVIIRINNGFTVATASDEIICPGDSVILNANGLNNATYTWSGGVVSGTPFTPPSPGATYTVTGVDVNGCTSIDSIHIVVSPLPVVNANVTDSMICFGDIVTFTGSGTANVYSWNNTVVDGVPYAPTASGTYTVTGIDTVSGCENTASVNIVVIPSPTVTFSIGLDSVCVSASPINLSGSPAGGVFSGTGVTGTTFNPATGTGSYTITYTVTDGDGCEGSNADIVDVIGCLGIEDPNQLSVNLYPNPADDHVLLSVNDINAIRLISITDMSGKVIYAHTGPFAGQLSISTGTWSQGMYMVQVSAGEKTYYKKLVVR